MFRGRFIADNKQSNSFNNIDMFHTGQRSLVGVNVNLNQ